MGMESMYGIFTYIYHKNQPNVSKCREIYHTWILWDGHHPNRKTDRATRTTEILSQSPSSTAAWGNVAVRAVNFRWSSPTKTQGINKSWQPLGPLLKVKLLVGPRCKIPLNSKGAKGIRRSPKMWQKLVQNDQFQEKNHAHENPLIGVPWFVATLSNLWQWELSPHPSSEVLGRFTMMWLVFAYWFQGQQLVYWSYLIRSYIYLCIKIRNPPNVQWTCESFPFNRETSESLWRSSIGPEAFPAFNDWKVKICPSEDLREPTLKIRLKQQQHPPFAASDES